jgi:hypothetical protein
MRNLYRTLALAAALTLTGLTVQASTPLGPCSVRCVGGTGFPPPTYTVGTTKEDCCSGNYSNLCPVGTTPVTISWNYMRCAP